MENTEGHIKMLISLKFYSFENKNLEKELSVRELHCLVLIPDP